MEDNFEYPGMMDDVKFFRKNMFLFKHQKSKPTTSEYTPKSTYTQEFAFPSHKYHQRSYFAFLFRGTTFSP